MNVQQGFSTHVRRRGLGRFAEDDLYEMLQKMGASEAGCRRYMRKRFAVSFLFGSLALALGLSFHWAILAVSAPLVCLITWALIFRMTKNQFTWFLFKQEYLFSRFMQEIIPRLEMNGTTVYQACLEVYDGMPREEPLKRALGHFLIGLREEPQSEIPFRMFAEHTCGSDEAFTFMHTLYDYQQATDDPEILYQLSLQNSRQIFHGIEEISRIKLKRLSLFPTVVTMLILIPMLAFCGGMIAQMVQMIHF